MTCERAAILERNQQASMCTATGEEGDESWHNLINIFGISWKSVLEMLPVPQSCLLNASMLTSELIPDPRVCMEDVCQDNTTFSTTFGTTYGTYSDFPENLHRGASQHSDYDSEVWLPIHILVWHPKIKTSQSHQKVTPSVYHENFCRCTENNGEISSPSLIILWPPKVKKVKKSPISNPQIF